MPGYATIGQYAALVLIILRAAQGVALGGTWDGLASLLSLNAPRHQRGWYAMVPQLGAPLALLVASGLFAFFLMTLSRADFLDWGWRYQIGRASCRERVCQYVSIPGVAVSLKKKHTIIQTSKTTIK